MPRTGRVKVLVPHLREDREIPVQFTTCIHFYEAVCRAFSLPLNMTFLIYGGIPIPYDQTDILEILYPDDVHSEEPDIERLVNREPVPTIHAFRLPRISHTSSRILDLDRLPHVEPREIGEMPTPEDVESLRMLIAHFEETGSPEFFRFFPGGAAGIPSSTFDGITPSISLDRMQTGDPTSVNPVLVQTISNDGLPGTSTLQSDISISHGFAAIASVDTMQDDPRSILPSVDFPALLRESARLFTGVRADTQLLENSAGVYNSQVELISNRTEDRSNIPMPDVSMNTGVLGVPAIDIPRANGDLHLRTPPVHIQAGAIGAPASTTQQNPADGRYGFQSYVNANSIGAPTGSHNISSLRAGAYTRNELTHDLSRPRVIPWREFLCSIRLICSLNNIPEESIQPSISPETAMNDMSLFFEIYEKVSCWVTKAVSSQISHMRGLDSGNLDEEIGDRDLHIERKVARRLDKLAMLSRTLNEFQRVTELTMYIVNDAWTVQNNYLCFLRIAGGLRGRSTDTTTASTTEHASPERNQGMEENTMGNVSDLNESINENGSMVRGSSENVAQDCSFDSETMEMGSLSGSDNTREMGTEEV